MSYESFTFSTKGTIIVAYVCENCGESTSYDIEITGKASGTTTVGLSSSEVAEKKALAYKNLLEEKNRRIEEQDLAHNSCPKCGALQSWQYKSNYNATNGIVAAISFTILMLVGVVVGVIRSNSPTFGLMDFIYMCAIPIVVPYILYLIVKYRHDRELKNMKIINEPKISWRM